MSKVKFDKFDVQDSFSADQDIMLDDELVGTIGRDKMYWDSNRAIKLGLKPKWKSDDRLTVSQYIVHIKSQFNPFPPTRNRRGVIIKDLWKEFHVKGAYFTKGWQISHRENYRIGYDTAREAHAAAKAWVKEVLSKIELD